MLKFSHFRHLPGGHLVANIPEEFLYKLHHSEFSSFSGFLPLAVFALAVTFLPCSWKNMAVAVLIIAIAMSGLHKLGFVLTLTDLAPQFTGIIFGISNTAGTVPGVVMPMVIAAMTPQVNLFSAKKLLNFDCG